MYEVVSFTLSLFLVGGEANVLFVGDFDFFENFHFHVLGLQFREFYEYLGYFVRYEEHFVVVGVQEGLGSLFP